MRSRILVIPAVSDLDSFSRLIAHLGHYLSYVNPERIAVVVDSSLLREAEEWLQSPSLPPEFGDRVAERVEAMRNKIALAAWPSDLEALVLTSDLILDWDVRRSDAEPWASIKRRYRALRSLFIIDWQGSRMGAARLADLGRILGQGRAFDRSQVEAFGRLAERVGRAPRAYLVGTGPSARTALDRDLSDGIRIICNTVVLDDELMDHVRPHILAFADPIFHFGPSTYAQRFQQAVVEQSRKHDFSIVTTEHYAPLLRAHNPEIAERVIALRHGKKTWPDNFDLVAHPAVLPYANVLTILMLPLGASFARSVGLIGFDGRNPDENYFWRHGSTVQFDRELQEIRLVHPGFFEVDYADYYADHIATLERLFVGLDERGIEVRSLANSFVPALRRRSMAPFEGSPVPATESRPMLVSLAPDWIGDAGHHGPFERRVHEVAEATGHAHIALASAGLQPVADWQIPTFSEPTYGSGGRFAPVGRLFEGELRIALEHLRLRPDAVLYLYTADVWHVVAILAVAADYPDMRFVVNLMRSHGWLDRALDNSDPWVESLVDLLRECLIAAARTNVDVVVDSEALARDVELLTGQPVLVWPMIAVSGMSPGRTDPPLAPGAPHIVAPVQAQSGRGFADLVALAERARERLERGELRLTTRWPLDGANPPMIRLAERFEEQGGQLVKGILADEAYMELVASADVVLVPYRIRPFRTRTSAVAIDALLAGKPVVAVRGTWAGDLIERYGAGLTYADGDVADMDSALTQVISHLDMYRSKVAAIGSVVQAEYAPERLVEFLRDGRTAPKPDAQAPVDTDDLRERTDRMRRLHQWHVVAENSTRMDGAIREDDHQRTIEIQRDEADALKRAIAHGDRARGVRGGAGRRGAAVKGDKRVAIWRRGGIRRAMSGSLRAVFALCGFLILLAGGLAVTGYDVPALLALAAAVGTSALGTLVVAVRLERRT